MSFINDISINDLEMISVEGGSASENRFDEIMGAIEDVIMSLEYQELQNGFMEKHYKEFEDTEENKFIYTDIFQEYTNIFENYLTKELEQRVSGFSMSKFTSTLQQHKSEITDDIFDMFLTFTDFIAFKEMFLDYKAEKEGRNADLMMGLVVQPLQPLHNFPHS